MDGLPAAQIKTKGGIQDFSNIFWHVSCSFAESPVRKGLGTAIWTDAVGGFPNTRKDLDIFMQFCRNKIANNWLLRGIVLFLLSGNQHLFRSFDVLISPSG